MKIGAVFECANVKCLDLTPVSRGFPVEPGPTDYLGQWQVDYAPLPGNVCRSSRVRPLRADDRISAYERHRSTGKPRAIGAERR